MIKMIFTNNSASVTLSNPVVNYGSFTDHVIHSPGPTLGPNGVNDYLEVDQTLGSVVSLGDSVLQAYQSPNTSDYFVVVATLPFKTGIGWSDPSWTYWIGDSNWPPPGQSGWVQGGTGSTKFAWGPMQVGVVPALDSDIVLNISFYDH
jgi:hypothetical protein